MKLRTTQLTDPRQLDFFTSDVWLGLPADTDAPAISSAPEPNLGPEHDSAAPTTLMLQGTHSIQLGEQRLGYTLRRSKRRSIGFLIDDDGLRVSAPKWVSIADIELAIREKQRWVLSKLHERVARVAQREQQQMRWEDGATLSYLGSPITLRLRAAHSVATSYDDSTRELSVSLPAAAAIQQLKISVQKWLQQEARSLFAARLPLYAEKLGVGYHSLALSSATTQWGSCNSQGKIRLNWRLIHFALPLIDYVIAHELSHLREMNHSPRFWATVQSIFPEYEAARRDLREHARTTLPIF